MITDKFGIRKDVRKGQIWCHSENREAVLKARLERTSSMKVGFFAVPVW
jgi:hypothetical protein